MNKKLLIIALILTICCISGSVNTRTLRAEAEQEANQQGWRDFDAFVGLLDSTDSAIQDAYNHIISLQSEKAEIIDEAERLAEITKIIDIHPDYNMEDIVAKLATLETLRAYLVDNGYVE